MLAGGTHLELGAGLRGRAGGLAVRIALWQNAHTSSAGQQVPGATAGGPRLAGAVFPSAERGRERKRTRCSSAVSSATWALRRSTSDIAVGGEGLGGGEKGGGGAEQLRSWDSVRFLRVLCPVFESQKVILSCEN